MSFIEAYILLFYLACIMSSPTITQIPNWNMKSDYVETCNCDYGCLCNFNGFPTYGSCQALILFHIRTGKYGNTNLDGLDFITAVSWPKAIHEGNGTAQLFVTNKASEEQRQPFERMWVK
jgi:hypothetical protein